MSIQWIVTGIILLGGMLAGGISLYVKRRREAKENIHFNLEQDDTTHTDSEINGK